MMASLGNFETLIFRNARRIGGVGILGTHNFGTHEMTKSEMAPNPRFASTSVGKKVVFLFLLGVKRRKCSSVSCILSFSHHVFKSLLPQGCKIQALSEKGLINNITVTAKVVSFTTVCCSCGEEEQHFLSISNSTTSS